MSLHDGHRARVKRRFLEHGADVFDDHQLLELLLYYSVPQGDTNPLAHRLINEFGSLSAVLDASVEDLLKVPGVGQHTAILLHLITPLTRRYLLSRTNLDAIITSTQEAGAYLLPFFHGMRNECVYMLCMDAKGKLLSCCFLGEGSLNSASVDNRKVVEAALTHRASAVILAHNHTSGIAVPSQDDIRSTLLLRELLRGIQVELIDHIVLADDDFTSMRDSGLI